MFLINKGRYYQDNEIIYSDVYGRGIYKWTGRMVEDPLGVNEGRVSPLLENMETGEIFFMKWIYEYSKQAEHIRKVKNPPDRKDILWPCDLIRVEDENQLKCDLTVDQIYSYSHKESREHHGFAVLFSYGGYPVCEDGGRYLSHIGKKNWKNEKIRNMVIQIAEHIKNINDNGYLYLDFHLSRMFFRENGELFLNYSNLVLPFFRTEKETLDTNYQYRPEIGIYPVEFAEPAIIQEKQKYFDYRSQNYSMAAMFFFLLFGRYAYDGRLMDGYMDDTEREHYEKFRDYHKMPVFIFDSKDTTNALGTFADEQVILNTWNEAPEELRNMFLAVLCQKNAQRIGNNQTFTPAQWLECFIRLGWHKEKTQ